MRWLVRLLLLSTVISLALWGLLQKEPAEQASARQQEFETELEKAQQLQRQRLDQLEEQMNAAPEVPTGEQ